MVAAGTSELADAGTSQEVCPRNVGFTEELAEGSGLAAREVIARKGCERARAGESAAGWLPVSECNRKPGDVTVEHLAR